MSDLNTYSFSGRLGADPELKYTQGGMAVWSARVAVGYGYGDNKGTNWLTIKSFGKRAEAFGKWTLSKGQQVWGSGELQVSEYDRKDGTKGTSVDCLIEQFGSAASEARTAPVSSQPATFDPNSADEFKDDIPF